MESAITVKGQATIPKAIREHLRLKPGDREGICHGSGAQIAMLPNLGVCALSPDCRAKSKALQP